MPGPDADPVARVIAGRKKWQPVAMIEVGMGEKQVEVARLIAFLQRIAEQAQPRAGIKDE